MNTYCLRCDHAAVDAWRMSHPGSRTVLVPGHCRSCGGPVVTLIVPAAG